MSRVTDLLWRIEEATTEVGVAMARRDQAIIAAVKAGASGPAVGKAAGISRARVSQIMKATERKS